MLYMFEPVALYVFPSWRCIKRDHKQCGRNLHLAGSLCLDRRAWQSLSTPTLDSWQPLCLQHWALQFLFALRCQGLAKQAPTLSTKVW